MVGFSAGRVWPARNSGRNLLSPKPRPAECQPVCPATCRTLKKAYHAQRCNTIGFWVRSAAVAAVSPGWPTPTLPHVLTVAAGWQTGPTRPTGWHTCERGRPAAGSGAFPDPPRRRRAVVITTRTPRFGTFWDVSAERREVRKPLVF